MEKRSALGAQKKVTKRRKKTFAKSVIDYLTADSYMYAPLFDSSTKFSSPDAVRRPSGGFRRSRIEIEQTSVVRERNFAGLDK